MWGRDTGIVYVWGGLFLGLLVAVIGVSTDMALVMAVNHQLQNAADAAALAGAGTLYLGPTVAHQKAKTLAYENFVGGQRTLLADNLANASAGDIVIGVYSRKTGQFAPTLKSPNAVRVLARRTEGAPGGPVPLLFGRIFGVAAANLSRGAIAVIGGSTGGGVVVLDRGDTPNAMIVKGTAALDTGAGAIWVNSCNTSQAAWIHGNATVRAPELNVLGATYIKGTVYMETPDRAPLVPQTFPAPVNDPLAEVPEPSQFGPTRTVTKINSGTQVLQAGYYPNGLEVTGGTVTCQPGIYVVDGVGLQLNGGKISAQGVMFYIVDTTPSNNVNSSLYIGGNADVYLTPPADGPYAGIAFFQARNNPNEATVIGTGGLTKLQGTLYFPRAKLTINGSGSVDQPSIALGNQLIVYRLDISGTAVCKISYDGRNPVGTPRPYLVK